jgi:hypothetical protein
MNNELFRKAAQGDKIALAIVKVQASQGNYQAHWFLQSLNPHPSKEIEDLELKGKFKKTQKSIMEIMSYLDQTKNKSPEFRKAKRDLIEMCRVLDKWSDLLG